MTERPAETLLGAKGAEEGVQKLLGRAPAEPRTVEPAPRAYTGGGAMPKETGLLHEAQIAQTEETKAVKEEVKKSNELLRKIADKPASSPGVAAIPSGINELNLIQ